jgi:hypothetical protein
MGSRSRCLGACEQVLRERPDLEDAAKVPYYVVFDLVRGEA